MPSIDDGIRVRFLENGKRSSAGAVPNNNGYIVGGSMSLATHNLGSYIQSHEQGHNLGFGHTDAWDGLMTYEVAPGPGKFTLQFSVNDVAHIQVYIDAFSLQYSEGISFGVLEWMQAFDIPSLPETSSTKYPGWTPE